MSLATYSDLQTAIANWLNRSDLTAKIPDFITLCEATLRRRVVHESGLSDSVDFTIPNQTRDLPDDFNGVIALLTDDSSCPVVPYRAPNDFFNFVNNSSGLPEGYTIAANKIYIRPYPTSVTFTLIYKQKLDLVQYGPNWLLLNHPDAYLYGSLVAAEPYIVEDDRVPMWKAMFEQALSEIATDNKRLKSAGPAQMASNNPLGVL